MVLVASSSVPPELTLTSSPICRLVSGQCFTNETPQNNRHEKNYLQTQTEIQLEQAKNNTFIGNKQTIVNDSTTQLNSGLKKIRTIQEPPYTAPLLSPFYYNVISPFCDYLVRENYVPQWVTPNQLSFAGLICSVMAVACAQFGLYIFVAPCWWGYGLLDNLDGKQARKTKTSSNGGDFVDHAVDSIVASLSVLVILALLVPGGTASWVAVLLTVFGQLPFYLGCWAHNVLGRVLLGTQISGTDCFTVDEMNFIFVPLLVFVRLFFPNLLDATVLQHPVLAGAFKSSGQSNGSVGLIIVFLIIIVSCLSSTLVVLRVYEYRVLPLLLPGLGFATLGIILQPPLLLMIPCFSLMAFELIAHRLHLPGSCSLRIWIPVIFFGLISIVSRIIAVEVTWGLSNPITAVSAIALSSFTLSLLIQYKNAINQIEVSKRVM